MRKITILILCAFVCYEGTFAQTNYQSQMDSIFTIPSSKVTTGLLIDRSPAVLSMNGYNGDSVAVCNSKDWITLFYRLYASYLNPADFHYDLTLANKYLYNVENNYPVKIPLGIIYYQYNKIKPFAISDGLLSVDTINSKIIDISGSNQTPLELDTCIAVASLIDTVRVGINLFYIDPALFVSNLAGNIQNIQIDFGDGNGFVPVSVGSTVNVSYSTLGNKNLIIKVTTNFQKLCKNISLYS